MRKAIKNKTWFSSRYLWLLIWRLAGIVFDGTCFTAPSSLSCIMMTHTHLMKFLNYTPFLLPLWCIQNSYTVRNSVRYTQNAHAKKIWMSREWPVFCFFRLRFKSDFIQYLFGIFLFRSSMELTSKQGFQHAWPLY